MTHPTRPELRGTFGLVASTHWLASGVGQSVLERGGNAFDAAVAAGFTLQVVEPHLNGPGGDSSTVLWSEADRRPYVVCGQGVSPAAATIEHFTGLELDLVPGSGLLAATVPGAFGAWLTLLERWGTWELADLLEPALHYAERGFPVLPAIAATIDTVRELFTAHWTPSAETWLDGGRAPTPGTWWRSPVLAATYRRVLAEATGRTREQRLAAAGRAWYDGFVAEAIGDFSRTPWRDSSGADHAGLLSADDLAGWSAPVESTAQATVAGRYTVHKTGPWAQGPVLLQQLLLHDAAGLGEMRVRSGEWVHTLVESAKLAFADREAYYGDPDRSPVPMAELLGPSYAAERARQLGPDASRDLRPGRVGTGEPWLAPLPGQAADTDGLRGATGEPTVGRLGSQRGDTCHVDVVDRFGNLVSVTPSGGWLQSSPTVPALGFGLGTRAQMFYLAPGHPNALGPSVRPRSTLSPTLVFRDDLPWLACGTPGGDQQDQWQAVLLADAFARERAGQLDLQACIDAPAFHSNHFPSSFHPRDAHPGQLVVEDRFGDDVIAELTRRGHEVVRSGRWSLGRLSAVAREDGWFRAAANPRGAQGYAVGR